MKSRQIETKQVKNILVNSTANIHILSLVLLITVISSCAGDQNLKNSSIPKATAKTQALLSTQSFDFDIEDPNKISGDYIQHKKITVPSNLTAQNKWLMFEGPVLENDLVAYRYYADSRHRFDIYGKKVSDLVMDTVSWDYHNIMDWGSDILKVGNSLGLGSPAIWYQDSLYTLSVCEEKTIEILQSNSTKSTIRTTFKNLNIDDNIMDVVQDWSIEVGKPWSEVHLNVTNGELPKTMSFATGIVKHLSEIIQGETDGHFYAMNWGIQSFHDQQLGMAVLANKQYQPRHIDNKLSHAYAFRPGLKEVRYRFLSAWEEDMNGVKDVNGFKKLVEESTK